jgi:outer membrane lipoprotein-sorting protein
MKTRHAVPVLLLIICLLYGSVSALSRESDLRSESELDRVIKKIKEKEASLKTFTATFRQTKTSDLLSEPLHSEGIVYFDIDGGILMKVTSPSPLILLLRENQQVIYYPDLSRVEKKSFGITDDILRQYLGIGESVNTLKTRFDIEMVANSPAKHYHLKLIPKQPGMAKHIQMIDVEVDAGHWLPEQIQFKGMKGDCTTIQMQYTSINEPLPSNIFTIEMPEGVATDSRMRE